VFNDEADAELIEKQRAAEEQKKRERDAALFKRLNEPPTEHDLAVMGPLAQGIGMAAAPKANGANGPGEFARTPATPDGTSAGDSHASPVEAASTRPARTKPSRNGDKRRSSSHPGNGRPSA